MDEVVAGELLRAVEPMAIEAALEAERRHMEHQAERRRMAELDLQKARYEASLAERRYAACDPDNRLIAAQLEKNWEAALRRVESCEARVASVSAPVPVADVPDFAGLADDLQAAWNAPTVTTRARQRLLRTSSSTSSPTSMRRRAKSSSPSTGRAASTRSCVSPNRNPASTAAGLRRRRWR
ncbi:hypothetical protein [Azospirillum argentinense]